MACFDVSKSEADIFVKERASAAWDTIEAAGRAECPPSPQTQPPHVSPLFFPPTLIMPLYPPRERSTPCVILSRTEPGTKRPLGIAGWRRKKETRVSRRGRPSVERKHESGRVRRHFRPLSNSRVFPVAGYDAPEAGAGHRGHFIPRSALEDAARNAFPNSSAMEIVSSPLLKEEWYSVFGTGLLQGYRPCGVHWACPVSAFTADDHPMDPT